jgi:hypothetical protein
MQMFTNAYSVGFGDINRGINMRSEFLDSKWRALLAELDLSYRQMNGNSELPYTLDNDITMCDWRNSFSDGSKMYSFPVPWPIKPAHASEFYLGNSVEHVQEMTGAISNAPWSIFNTQIYNKANYDGDFTNWYLKGCIMIYGVCAYPFPDDQRKRLVEPVWLNLANARFSAGEKMPLGFKACEAFQSYPQSGLAEFKFECVPGISCTSASECTYKAARDYECNPETDTGCRCGSLWPCMIEKNAQESWRTHSIDTCWLFWKCECIILLACHNSRANLS